jgi:hypothetical protein
MIALALLLAAQPVTVTLTPDQEQALLCRGPVAYIPDDDPGLALYREEIAEQGIEAAKVRLAFERGENCGPDDRLSAMTIAERLAIAERLLCPNGVNDWTEEGPSCD